MSIRSSWYWLSEKNGKRLKIEITYHFNSQGIAFTGSNSFRTWNPRGIITRICELWIILSLWRRSCKKKKVWLLIQCFSHFRDYKVVLIYEARIGITTVSRGFDFTTHGYLKKKYPHNIWEIQSAGYVRDWSFKYWSSVTIGKISCDDRSWVQITDAYSSVRHAIASKP